MRKALFTFLDHHSSLVLTTHNGADPDGMGAEIVFAKLCRAKGKKVRIINAAPVPKRYAFMDPEGIIESWDDPREELPSGAALVILDTSDEYNIGAVKDFVPAAAEVFVVDHHESSPFCTFQGYFDNTASSVCEMMVETAVEAGLALDKKTALAAYTGIIYDSGSFAYSKTTPRTFRAALALIEAGANPYEAYHQLNETASTGSIMLQKIVLSSLELAGEGRVAVQILRKEDLDRAGARYEDAEGFINIPLRANDIEVSIFVKENPDGEIRVSLRSKGKVNVSKIAQNFGGGGHVAAAGFRSKENLEDTREKILEEINDALYGEKDAAP